MLCTATSAEGQERAASPTAAATMRASVTMLPSIDAASFAGVRADLARAYSGEVAGGATPVVWVAAPRATDGATPLPSWSDPPVARSFERFAHEGRTALRHTIAVLY